MREAYCKRNHAAMHMGEVRRWWKGRRVSVELSIYFEEPPQRTRHQKLPRYYAVTQGDESLKIMNDHDGCLKLAYHRILQ